MPTLPLTAWSPSGNVTVLAPAEGLDYAAQARAATAVLAANPWQAEQMGFYTATPPRLRMAGGEFCCNATRALAVLLARQGCLTPVDHDGTRWQGKIFTSGLEQNVRVSVTRHDDAFSSAVIVECAPPPCEQLDEGITLVRVPGISHLLIDPTVLPFPGDWRQCAAELLRRFGLENEAATGCIWRQKLGTGWRIAPVVTVRDPFTVFYESACGSGSMALAMHLLATEGAQACRVWQPSGMPLEISVARHTESTLAVCVDGPVRFMGSGEYDVLPPSAQRWG